MWRRGGVEEQYYQLKLILQSPNANSKLMEPLYRSKSADGTDSLRAAHLDH